MALSFVQAAGPAATGSGSVSLAYGSNNSAGNLLIAMVQEAANANPVITINDTQINTWKSLPTNPYWINNGGFTIGVYLYYCLSCKSGANTVTASGTSLANTTIELLEYTGATDWVLDQYTGLAVAETTVTTPNITTLIPAVVLVAAGAGCGLVDVSEPSISPGSAIGRISSGGTCGLNLAASDLIVSSTGTFSAAAGNVDNESAAAILASFGNGTGRFLINPGMDGGMVPQMKGGMNA